MCGYFSLSLGQESLWSGADLCWGYMVLARFVCLSSVALDLKLLGLREARLEGVGLPNMGIFWGEGEEGYTELAS